MNGVRNRKIITQNLYAGEKALRSFKSEFPVLNSNTHYNLLIERHKNNEQYSELIPKLKGKSILAGLKMNCIRSSYNSASDKTDYLKKAIKFQKVANCQERAFLVHNELNSMGIQSQNIRLNFVPKDGMKIVVLGTVSVFERDRSLPNICKSNKTRRSWRPSCGI